MLMRIKSGVYPEIGMAKRVANSGSSYSDSTKLSIAKEVLLRPGQTGRQIAHRLNLDRSRVNAFLYGEGKKKFGLTVNNWRWYDLTRSSSFSENKNTKQSSADPLPSHSICHNLQRLPITQAILMVRTMNLERVELTFAEDDYGLLDERLKAELAMRRAELLSASRTAKQAHPKRSNLWLWALLILVGIWVLNSFGSGNDHKNRVPQTENIR